MLSSLTKQEITKIGKLANQSFPKATKNGIWGDPRRATKKEGHVILDEIIKNRDCKALQEWELDHSFDESLDITSKQMTEGVQLAMECTGKVLDNMMDTSTSIITDEYEIQITLDKQQYRVGERIHVDVTISPDWLHLK